MIEITGDLFKQQADVLCITTNGYVKANGDNVMGMGCAKRASEINKNIPSLLGKAIKKNGNVVNHIIRGMHLDLYSFPVKSVIEKCLPNKSNVVRHMKDKVQVDFPVVGWACVARTSIIVESARQLLVLADANGWTKIVIPRPGCGAGELDWRVVKPILDSVLDNRFYSITF